MKKSGFIPGRKLHEGQVVWVVGTRTVGPQTVASTIHPATIESVQRLKGNDSGKYAVQYVWFSSSDCRPHRRSFNYKIFALRHFTLPESSTAFFKTKKEAVAFMKDLTLTHRQCIPSLWGSGHPTMNAMRAGLQKTRSEGFLITEEAKAIVRKRFAILKEDENGNIVPTEEGRAMLQSMLAGQGAA
jgi:hypothetical protein